MTIVTSPHPDSSKWWCSGAILNTRLPVSLKKPIWITSLSTMSTNIPPMIAPRISVRLRIVRAARAPPRASEPVSPMKIRAGEAFHHRNPNSAPVIAAATIARSSGSRVS